MIRVKYQALQFGKMSEQNLWAFAKATLLKIHVITGWTIPTDDMMKIFLDQFIQKIKESYPNTNPEEWGYAFRNFGTTVKDWGKAMNLALIDEVMIPYMEERFRLSHEVEEKKDQPPPTRIYSDEEIDNLHRAWTEEFYQQIKRGIVKNVPAYSREILRKDGLIKELGEADDFFVNALNKQKENIYVCER